MRQQLKIWIYTILNEASVVSTNIAEEQVSLLTHDFGPNMSNKECPVDIYVAALYAKG